MADRHTILVVDDEPDVVKSVQDLLRLEYRVLGATRAKAAMDIMSSEEVHVVMTDQRMPDITGVEFLRQIRGDYPEAIRLLFTGYADIRAVIDAINQGNVYRYITKPWDPEELEATIRQAVERYDLLVERRKLIKNLQISNTELATANAELSRANELKRAFIQVASHELRTPLTILLGLEQLALQQAIDPNPLRPLLMRIDMAGKRLQRIIDQLVKMLSAGNFDKALDRTPTDMAALLTDAAEEVRPFISLRKQTLDLRIPADLGMLGVDALKIRDCISHLMLNAVKFTPDGGRVTLAANRTPTGIEIRVSDTGTGIDSACLTRVFEPFFTGFDVSHHSSGHYEFGRRGLGLGLSIARAFIEMHGGTIACQSEVGKGSTFVIWLPTDAPREASPSLGAQAAPAS
ncbi:MAG TPA: hybrid sensor histidine kinase/response regulator [Tepidisphaeraceae bacterium]|jgi:signal transduction histidine kinase|nr:hybrid sensor histidine kinase/response regulator [Tepidisphaeraceae bacterium]